MPVRWLVTPTRPRLVFLGSDLIFRWPRSIGRQRRSCAGGKRCDAPRWPRGSHCGSPTRRGSPRARFQRQRVFNGDVTTWRRWERRNIGARRKRVRIHRLRVYYRLRGHVLSRQSLSRVCLVGRRLLRALFRSRVLVELLVTIGLTRLS